jgi:hypothetical protein
MNDLVALTVEIIKQYNQQSHLPTGPEAYHVIHMLSMGDARTANMLAQNLAGWAPAWKPFADNVERLSKRVQ